MIYLIIYLIGCVIAYIISAMHNDKYFYDKMSGLWIITSWIIPLSVIIGMIVVLISEINLYPSLRWFKKLIKHEK